MQVGFNPFVEESSDKVLAILAPEQSEKSEPVTQLARALRQPGGFAMYFACCDDPTYQPELVERVQIAVGKRITIVDLTTSKFLRVGTPEEGTAEHVVFFYGLDSALRALPAAGRAELLQVFRTSRTTFLQDGQAVVVWLSREMLTVIAQIAPDFYDWNSGIYEFP